MIRWLVIAAMLTTGCSVVDRVPSPLRDESFVHIKLVDELRKGTLATARVKDGLCVVEIRKDVYPNCVTHEIMHCFSGNWHEGYETDDYCYIR